MGDDFDAPEVDEAALAFQIQVFLDEWHYRVMHSGMAYYKDRITCVRMALDLMDAHGVPFVEGEKETFSLMDEKEMIELLIQRMSYDMKRTFEHFALQLQLVVSATTRVRSALEEVKAAKPYGEHEVWRAKLELVEAVDNDTGICNQILRESVLEATNEVNELNMMHDSWWKNTRDRVGRLVRCSDESEKAQSQLASIQSQLDTFAQEQNAKSKTVLMGMASSSNRAQMEAAFKAWLGSFLRYKQEKEIHDKFRKQIDDAQQRLLDFRAGNKAGVKSVLMRNVGDHNRLLSTEVFRTWQKYMEELKEEALLKKQTEQAKAKILGFQEQQVANTKKVMMRMTAGRDSQMAAMTFQAWQKGINVIRRENMLDEAAKEMEKTIKEHVAKKSNDAKQVISRMLGSGDQGLLLMIRGAWNDFYKQEKRAQELDEAVQNANKKFSEMSAKQKRVVKNTADRINALEEELQVHFIFQQWCTQAKLERVYRHYTGKMDVKRHQLEAVQSMFKTFASQLEQGVSTTPRSQRAKRTYSDTRGGDAPRPPGLPPAPPPRQPSEAGRSEA